MCCDYMLHKGIGRELLIEDTDDKFMEYIANMRRDKVWGDDPEIRAMEEMLDTPIEVWNADLEDGGEEPSTIHLSGSFPRTSWQTKRDPIRLSYHGYSRLQQHHSSGQASTHHGQRLRRMRHSRYIRLAEKQM